MRVLILGLVLCASCNDASPTRTLLRFGTAADLSVPVGTQLRLRGFRHGARQHEAGEDLGAFTFTEGIELPIEADGDDADRRFTVFAELVAPGGERLSWARVRSGFVQDERSEVQVEFASACPAPSDQLEQGADYSPENTCGSHDTCHAGECVSACVQPRAYGEGTAPNAHRPCPLADDLGVDELEMGFYYSCGLHDGETFCWSQVGFGTENNRPQASRTMTPNGRTTFNRAVDSALDFAATIRSACLVAADGSLRCGGDREDSIGMPPADGEEHCCITVVEAPPAVAVDVSNTFACLITEAGGQLYCSRSRGPFGGEVGAFVPADVGGQVPQGLRALFTGINILLLFTNDGSELITISGSVPSTTIMLAEEDVMDVSASRDGVCLVLNSGELLCWTREVPVAEQPRSYGMGWRRIALAEFNSSEAADADPHRCGVRDDGTLLCWGDNASSKLGVEGPARTFAERAQVGTDTDWVDVAAGHGHTCGIREGGHVYCWGSNTNGALGYPGPNTHIPTHVPIPGW